MRPMPIPITHATSMHMSILRLAIALNTAANSGIERSCWANTLAFFSFSLVLSSGCFFCCCCNKTSSSARCFQSVSIMFVTLPPLGILFMGILFCDGGVEYLKDNCEATNKAKNIKIEKTKKQTL